jgi:LuxR family maltose regulon positive regulatory protein
MSGAISDAMPRPLPRLVPRQRVYDLLDRATTRSVTLVCAAAGSGKSAVVAAWLRERTPGHAAWVTVSRDERDPSHFWSAVAAALHVAEVAGPPAPDGGDDELARRLLEATGAQAAPVLLVIDDLHELLASTAREGLARMLAAAPAQLRTVLISRHRPDVGLHRHRLTGELTEIEAADLAFDDSEAEELLLAAGVELSAAGRAILRERTEGWAAGLRLAADSLARSADPERAAVEFTGGERTVAEYLTAEVLAGRPEPVRDLLRRTCLGERVSAPLADALTGRTDGQRILWELATANALVVPLDADRRWFRYHRLLADVLRQELGQDFPEQISELRRAAARWYADHGLVPEALTHATAGEDWAAAAELLAQHWLALFARGRQDAIHDLLPALPADAEIAAVAAADRFHRGDADEAEVLFEHAVRLGESLPEHRRVRFAITLACVRLVRFAERSDFTAMRTSAQALLSPLEGENALDVLLDQERCAFALLHLGIAERWLLEVADAERHLQEARRLAGRTGQSWVALGALAAAAEVANMRQQLDAAEARAREAIALSERLGSPQHPIVATAHAALAGALLGKGDLGESSSWLDRGERLAARRPESPAAVQLAFARGALRFAQGRHAEALERFAAAELALAQVPEPVRLKTLARTWQLRVRIAQADLETARRALSEADDGGEWAVVAARLHLAEDDAAAAFAALTRLREDSDALPYSVLALEARLLEAAALDRMGQRRAAERALEGALDVAGCSGHVWLLYTISGAAELLRRHPSGRTAHGSFIAELLDRVSTSAGARSPTPLTNRELVVLGYLPTNLSAAQIASELVVSVHTVKTHMRSLYAKLGVHRRADAVARARDLGLLAPGRGRR